MEYLLSAWPEVMKQIQESRNILFLADFDGTLTPIAEKPELAFMSVEIRQLLDSLARQPHLTVGIISGRALSDLKEKINLDNIIYSGNHGFEIEGPGLNFINPIANEIRPFFRAIKNVLTLALGSIKGVLIEDKGITLSVHYRQVETEKVPEVESAVKKVVSGPATGGVFMITPGKEVYDVKPAASWDKGKAIRLLMKRFGKGGRRSGLLPIYLGDDLTDEDGFQVIEKYGQGITVHVGEKHDKSAARYYLRSPEEVSLFMSTLLTDSQKAFSGEHCSISQPIAGLNSPSQR
jgi:trehalose 6-phosphate phosphatase